MKILKKVPLLLSGILLLGIILRFYQLGQLPGEIYGDIILVYDWTDAILSGRGLPPFFLSVGPLYFYLTAPIVRIFGDSYYVLKMLSTIVGLATIIVTYILAKGITKSSGAALFASFILASSKWHIAFSRIGHQLNIVPLVVALAYIFLVRFLASGKKKDVFLTGIFSGLALYTYIPAWVFPPLVGLTLAWVILKKRKFKQYGIIIISLYAVIILLLSFPVVQTIFRDNENFFGNGYIGSKLFVSYDSRNKFVTWMDNVRKSFLMFHVTGDIVFRHNPPREPQLDIVSGIFLLVGLVMIVSKRREMLFFTIIPILVGMLPASLVVNFPIDVPSSSRTIAILPFVSIIAGMGMHTCFKALSRSVKTYKLKIFMGIAGMVIVYLNVRSYFILYRYNLPNHNVPFGRIMAEKIVEKGNERKTYVIGCCWGDWGQPEPDGVIHALPANLRGNVFFLPNEFSCGAIERKKKPFVLIDPRENKGKERLLSCFPNAEIQTLYSSYGDKIVSIGTVEKEFSL